MRSPTRSTERSRQRSLYRLVIDCDVVAKDGEDAVRRVASALAGGALTTAAKRVNEYRIAEYETARCYVCGKMRRKEEMLHLGKDVYRCREHRTTTIIRKASRLPGRS